MTTQKRKQGLFTKLANMIDAILPSDTPTHKVDYGDWKEAVTLIKATIDGMKDRDINFLSLTQPTYISKVVFYPQDEISKQYLIDLFANYPNQSQVTHVYDGEDYRHQVCQLISDFGYKDLYVTEDMLMQINLEECMGEGKIGEIVNAGWLEYRNDLQPALESEPELESETEHPQQPIVNIQQLLQGDDELGTDNQDETSAATEQNLNSNQPQIEPAQAPELTSSNQSKDQPESQELNQANTSQKTQEETHQAEESQSNQVHQQESQDKDNQPIHPAKLDCELHDASGNQNISITDFPCCVGRNDDNDLVVQGTYVSGQHLTIKYIAGQFVIEDHSTNKTYLHNQMHDIKLSLHHAETTLTTGMTSLSLGGYDSSYTNTDDPTNDQTTDYTNNPKLVVHLAVQAEKTDNQPTLLNQHHKATPLNTGKQAEQNTEQTSEQSKQHQSKPQSNLQLSEANQSNMQADEQINWQTDRQSLASKETNAATSDTNSANKVNTDNLSAVTRLAPLFKLTLTDHSGEETYAVDNLPWTLGREANTNSVIKVNNPDNSTISRQHITLVNYDQLQQVLEVLVDGGNGAAVETVKYQLGDRFDVQLGEVVTVGLEQPAVGFCIFVDEYCR